MVAASTVTETLKNDSPRTGEVPSRKISMARRVLSLPLSSSSCLPHSSSGDSESRGESVDDDLGELIISDSRSRRAESRLLHVERGTKRSDMVSGTQDKHNDRNLRTKTVGARAILILSPQVMGSAPPGATFAIL